MKIISFKSRFITILIIFVSFSLIAADKIRNLEFSLGISAAVGGRYDNIRMCVASPAGIPGGPVMEFAAVTGRIKFSKFISLNLYIPMFRPILFGLAFQMLQFEPQVELKFHIKLKKKLSFILGAGTGISFHYGPDYRSPIVLRTASFVALGPIATVNAGFEFSGKKGDHSLTFGIRPFFQFIAGSGRNGIIGGGELFFGIMKRLF